MATYRGPYVGVQQVFQTSPAAIAVENLPTAVIGTAYDVYKDEKLLSYDGVSSSGTSVTTPWIVSGDNKVIYSESQGKKIYNQYPPAFSVIDSENGNQIAITPTSFGSTGVEITGLSTFNIAQYTNLTKAYIPYFEATGILVRVVDATNKKKLTLANGRFIDAGIVSGLRVVGTDNSVAVTIGYVDYVESNTVLYLKSDYTQAGATSVTAVYVGAAIDDTTLTINKACYLYDPTVNFARLGVKRGDVIKDITSNTMVIDNTSVVSVVSDNLIEIFAGAAESANYMSTADGASLRIDRVYSSTGDVIYFTAMVQNYDVARFLGFTEQYDNNGYQGAIAGSTLTLSAGSDGLSMVAGDKVVIAGVIYTILSGSGASYTIDKSATVSATALVAFNSSSKIVNDILADYRAVKVDNLGVVFKSSDTTLTGSAGVFGVSSVYNELAFMVGIVLGVNGGRVCYAIAVDPTESIATQYTDALEALKFYDVYSHCFGTDEAGVNAMIPSYCDEQSAPYEGHERIGVIAYNEQDVYKITEAAGGSPAVSTTGEVKIAAGSVNLQALGITIGDKITFYKSTSTVDGDIGYYTATVTASPSDAVTVQTDWVSTIVPVITGNLVFRAGNKSRQANMIKALGSGNHRVTTVWPGTFYADTTASGAVPALTNVQLPSYYISALVAGMDGGQNVSQSFTRLLTGIPGLSNIQLRTSSYFRKADLDIIGSGGIDILVQANPVSNTIYSRHDLTGDMSAVELRERSITKQADSAAKTLRAAFDPYVGKFNISPRLIKFLDQIGSAVRNVIIRDGVLVDLQINSIKRDPVIADKINVLVTATVFVAGNYYDITMNVVSR